MRLLIRRILFRCGTFSGLYKRWFCSSAREWADYLRLHSGFEAIGCDCEINRDATITDPYLVRIGDHVTLSTCSLISHDGSIKQIQRATGKPVDSVGRIDIRDNCFIGYGAIVLRGVTIGPDAIVAAGAVVTKNVLPGQVVAGVPAKAVSTIEELAGRLEAETMGLPWGHLICERRGAFDASVEETLREMRSEYFWATAATPAAR